ncbi:hypothetical protein QTO30_21160 [Yoonia sp. GPGPB17]
MAIWIKFRATEEQRDTWYEKARTKGVSFSDLARQTLGSFAGGGEMTL